MEDLVTTAEAEIRRADREASLAEAAESAARARRTRAESRKADAEKALDRARRNAEFSGPNAGQLARLADLREQALLHVEAAIAGHEAMVTAGRGLDAVAALAAEIAAVLPEADRARAFPATAAGAIKVDSNAVDMLRAVLGPALRRA